MSRLPAHKTPEQFVEQMLGRVPWPYPNNLGLPLDAEIFGFTHSTVRMNHGRSVDGTRGRTWMARGEPEIEVTVEFLVFINHDILTLSATWEGFDDVPPRGHWIDVSPLVRRQMDPSEDVIREAMRRGRAIPKPRATREPRIDPADVRQDVKAFDAAVEEIEKP